MYASHTPSLYMHTTMQNGGQPQQAPPHCREVASLQSKINGIDLQMGYQIARAWDQKELAETLRLPGNSGSKSS